MHRAFPTSDGPTHEVPASASLRSSPSLLIAARPAPVPTLLPSRPTLLPLSFVLTLVAAVSLGSSALSLVVAYLLFDRSPSTVQAAAPAPVETKPLPEVTPRPEAVKEKPVPPGADTLAVLPFEMLFEPTPTFQREVEKLNATLPQQLAEQGKLRVKPQAEMAPLRYCRDPIAAARDLKVRAVLVVKFTTEAGPVSTCHLELIDVMTGFLLWGTEIEAPGGFLKHPERLAEVHRSIVENVPKRMTPQQ